MADQDPKNDENSNEIPDINTNPLEVDEETRKAEEAKKQRQEQVQKRKAELQRKYEERASTPPPKPPANATVAPTPKPATAAPAPASTKAIREDVVASCVNFLNHPKVKGSPQDSKLAFLKKKGLTQEEIDEAFRRAEGGVTTTAAVPQRPTSQAAPVQQAAPQQYAPQYQYAQPMLPPGYQIVPAPPANPSWYGSRSGLAATVVSCVSVGVGLAWLAKKYFWNDAEEKEKLKLLQAKQEEEQKKREEEQKASMKMFEEMTNALKALQTQGSEMKELLKGSLSQSGEKSDKLSKQAASPQTDNNTKMVMSEMQAQINTLKAQLVDLRASSSEKTATRPTPTWTPYTQKPAIPSWQQQSSSPPPTSTTTTTTTTTSSSSEVTKPEEKAPAENESHPYSTDFRRIAEMVARGETPPGIKDINDKPQDPNARVEKGERESPAKPWLARQSPRIEEINEEPSVPQPVQT